MTTADFASRSYQRFRTGLLQRLPLGPRQLWRYTGAVGATGEGKAATAAVDDVISGAAQARATTRSRWQLRGIARENAKFENRAERSKRAQDSADENDGQQKLRVWDPFVQSVPAYLVSFVAVVAILEAAGMLTSLKAFDSTLGALQIPMAVASGGILVLGGHVIGDLVESAVRHRSLLKGLLAVAASVVVLGIIAIAWMGFGRDANLRSARDTDDAIQLSDKARKPEAQAKKLETPLPAGVRGRTPHVSLAARAKARRLHREAATMVERAGQLDIRARDERTLTFFIAVQALGLAVGSAGGFMFATAAARRLARSARRLDARAKRALARAHDRRAGALRIAFEEQGYAYMAGGGYGVQRGLAGKEPTAVTPSFDPERLVDRLIAQRIGHPLAPLTPLQSSTNGHGSPEHVPPIATN